jgi:hypothetical protein
MDDPQRPFACIRSVSASLVAEYAQCPGRAWHQRFVAFRSKFESLKRTTHLSPSPLTLVGRRVQDDQAVARRRLEQSRLLARSTHRLRKALDPYPIVVFARGQGYRLDELVEIIEDVG